MRQLRQVIGVKMIVSKKTLAIVLVLVLVLGLVASCAIADQKSIDNEIKLGKEAAEQAEKDLKLINDEAQLKRVNTIGQELAEVAKTTKVKALYGNDELANFTYTFKIVDDKDVNAFSLPGGWIYVNKGLLDRAESDDELAGVIAHEIAHAAHHHMAALLKKQAKLNTDMIIVAAVAILSGTKGTDTNNLLLGAQLLSIAKLNTYGREAEKDSDMAAIAYMAKTKYNPVGMLTFMEKLSADHTYRQENLGIFATHPPSKERADAITAELNKRGIPINRRLTSKTLMLSVKEVEVKGEKVYQVLIGDKPVFTAAAVSGKTSKDRAEEIARRLNPVLDQNPATRDVKLMNDGQTVQVKDVDVITITPEDARLAGSSQDELAAKTKQALDRILYNNSLKGAYW